MYNILDYGAVADGVTVCSKSIQAAIDACHANGGGQVVVPAGTFVTGTIWLKSNVELHLAHGALLKASENLADYNDEDAYEQNFSYPPEEWCGKHLIMILECDNVAITGTGTIDGSAAAYYDFENRILHGEYVWADGLSLSKDKVNLRPGQLLCFVESTNVRVTDICIRNATSWCCFFHGCEYITVRGLRVFNDFSAANTDGIDLDCCRFAAVSDCIIETGDDDVAIRCSGSKLKKAPPVCEHITISNCVLSCASSAFRIGVGMGNIRHIRVSNITLSRAGVGLHFMPTIHKHGCIDIEDVNFSNISAVNVGYPMLIGGDAGSVKNIVLDNIRMEAKAESEIAAHDSCVVSDLLLRDVQLRLCDEKRPFTERTLKERGLTALRVENAQRIRMERVSVTAEDSVAGTWQAMYAEKECSGIQKNDCIL